MILFNHSYHNLLKRGVRIALRAKVNDSSIIGLRHVENTRNADKLNDILNN